MEMPATLLDDIVAVLQHHACEHPICYDELCDHGAARLLVRITERRHSEGKTPPTSDTIESLLRRLHSRLGVSFAAWPVAGMKWRSVRIGDVSAPMSDVHEADSATAAVDAAVEAEMQRRRAPA